MGASSSCRRLLIWFWYVQPHFLPIHSVYSLQFTMGVSKVKDVLFVLPLCYLHDAKEVNPCFRSPAFNSCTRMWFWKDIEVGLHSCSLMWFWKDIDVGFLNCLSLYHCNAFSGNYEWLFCCTTGVSASLCRLCLFLCLFSGLVCDTTRVCCFACWPCGLCCLLFGLLHMMLNLRQAVSSSSVLRISLYVKPCTC